MANGSVEVYTFSAAIIHKATSKKCTLHEPPEIFSHALMSRLASAMV